MIFWVQECPPAEEVEESLLAAMATQEPYHDLSQPVQHGANVGQRLQTSEVLIPLIPCSRSGN